MTLTLSRTGWTRDIRVGLTGALTSYCTLFNQNSLKNFETLKRLYGLNYCDSFRFYQVQDYINSFMVDGQKALENSLLKVYFLAYRADCGNKVISRLYKGLQEMKTTSTIYVKQKWERESNSCIPEEVWLKYCEYQWRMSIASWRVFGWKSLSRYFSTPVQKSHHSASSSCWRKCGCQKANHHHMFWDCPKIKTFWSNIYTELLTIFKIKINFNWDECSLGF